MCPFQDDSREGTRPWVLPTPVPGPAGSMGAAGQGRTSPRCPLSRDSNEVFLLCMRLIQPLLSAEWEQEALSGGMHLLETSHQGLLTSGGRLTDPRAGSWAEVGLEGLGKAAGCAQSPQTWVAILALSLTSCAALV